MNLSDVASLLRQTRRLTVAVVVLLSIQLFGNLYEQLVTNVQTYADPRPGSVGELDPGSPLFFYLPWVPIGLILAVVLVVQLHRRGPAYVARRGRWALAALAVAVLAKAVLISQVNPEFRREDIVVQEIRSLAVVWGVGNGLAVIAVAVALVVLTSWRAGLLDLAATGPVDDAARAGNEERLRTA